MTMHPSLTLGGTSLGALTVRRPTMGTALARPLASATDNSAAHRSAGRCSGRDAGSATSIDESRRVPVLKLALRTSRKMGGTSLKEFALSRGAPVFLFGAFLVDEPDTWARAPRVN